MKKSFVAMALILVLCMSQFLIGNAAGKAMDITDSIAVNEGDAAAGAFTSEEVEGGVKFTGTSAKGEWACLMGSIEGNAKEYTKIKVVVEGKAGTVLKLKLQDGGADVIESNPDFTLVDGEQVLEWTVEAKNLTEAGGQKFVIFVNPGKAGATDPIIIKSVKLCTPDYEEPVETPDTGDTEIDDTADINTAPLYAVLVLGVVVVAIASKKRFAR